MKVDFEKTIVSTWTYSLENIVCNLFIFAYFSEMQI
jgi:hypothetical protein